MGDRGLGGRSTQCPKLWHRRVPLAPTRKKGKKTRVKGGTFKKGRKSENPIKRLMKKNLPNKKVIIEKQIFALKPRENQGEAMQGRGLQKSKEKNEKSLMRLGKRYSFSEQVQEKRKY